MPSENLERQVAELERRLAEVERHDRSPLRFFTQYLLSPLLVAGVAAGLNTYYQGQLETQRNEISQYELVNKMLPQLVHDSTQVAQATQVVLEHVIHDKALREQLNDVFRENVLAKTKTELEDAPPEQRERILREAYQVAPQLETQLNQYDEALRLEGNGFDALVNGDIDAAIRAFERVEEVYSGYHNAAELAALLRDNRERWDDPQVQQRVYRTVVEKYAWKAPQAQIAALREKLR